MLYANNPNLGTRQYPDLAPPLLPVRGYKSVMDTKEIGSRIRNARELQKLAQEQVCEDLRIGQSTLSRIELGDFKRLPSELPRLAKYLGLVYEDLDPEFSNVPTPAIGTIITGTKVIGRADWPVHASAEGGPGQIIVTTDPIEFAPRPGIVENVRESYGLIITGTSMIPEFKHGETAIVNPLMPLQPGESAIFYAEREGSARAMIKEYRRQTEAAWFVTQHNPPAGEKAEFTLARKEWQWAHRVMGKYSRR